MVNKPALLGIAILVLGFAAGCARVAVDNSSGTSPSAPTGVTATAGNGQVAISWTAVTGATSYNIYWSITSGVTKTSGTKITGATSPYSHTGRTNGTTYYYIATAVNSSGESAASAQVSATPSATAATGKIAFISFRDRNGNPEIYIMNADGSGKTRLTNNNYADWSPSLSPDGTKIAFVSTRDGNREIYVMSADGSGQTNLTNNAASDDYPSWSSDGTKIAFVSQRDGKNNIYVVNVDGSGQTRLTNDTTENDYNPSCSPTGTKIAFWRLITNTGGGQIYVMDANGSSQTNLTSASQENRYPCWSPDGTEITFFSNRDGKDDIFVMNVNGSSQTNLTKNAVVGGTLPSWSPTGTKIAFESSIGSNPSPDDNWEIEVINADGSGQTRLTNNSAEEREPSWSPDGTKIVFNSYRDGNWEIYVVDADGSNPTNLTNDAADDYRGIYY